MRVKCKPHFTRIHVYENRAPRTESTIPTMKPISAHLPIALARTGVVFWKHRNKIEQKRQNVQSRRRFILLLVDWRLHRAAAVRAHDRFVHQFFAALTAVFHLFFLRSYLRAEYRSIGCILTHPFTGHNPKIHKIFISATKNDRSRIGCGRTAHMKFTLPSCATRSGHLRCPRTYRASSGEKSCNFSTFVRGTFLCYADVCHSRTGHYYNSISSQELQTVFIGGS